jgi:hypothetical protein
MSSVQIKATKKEILVLTHRRKTRWEMEIKIFDSATSSALTVMIYENQHNSRESIDTLEKRMELLHENDTIEFCNCSFSTYKMNNIYYIDFICNVSDVKFELLDA